MNILRLPKYIKLFSQKIKNSKNKKAVFIWIPKNGGTSVFNILNSYGCQKLKTKKAIKYLFSQNGIVTFGHMSYLKLYKKNYISKDFNESAYKFCLVRNPYHRAVSLFHGLKRTGGFHNNLTFRTFCYILKDKAYNKLGLYSSKDLNECNPQYKWIVDENGNIFVDYIGRLEEFNKSITNITNKLNIKHSFEHRNKGEYKRNYNKYYDSELKHIIKTVYYKDFKRFNYDFKKI